MSTSVIFAYVSFISIVFSLLRFIPRWREVSQYEAEYKSECDRVSDMPHIEPPWYRPPDNGLSSAKAWLVWSAIVFVASCAWIYVFAV